MEVGSGVKVEFERKWKFLASIFFESRPVSADLNTMCKQSLQISVFLSTSKPKFDTFFSERLQIQITNFHINCLVWIYQNLGFPISTFGSMCKRPYNN